MSSHREQQLFEGLKSLFYGINFSSYVYSGKMIEWQVALGLDKSKINSARGEIIKEITRPLSAKEIAFAYTKTSGKIDLMLDDNYELANIIAYSCARGVDYTKLISNYKNTILKLLPNVNDFLKHLNLEKHIIAGVLPK